MSDLSQAVWRKAQLSQWNGGCVEVAVNLAAVVAVRDSKSPHAGAHIVSRPAFAEFVDDVKAGRYDLDA